jgi:hypothetical protein
VKNSKLDAPVAAMKGQTMFWIASLAVVLAVLEGVTISAQDN